MIHYKKVCSSIHAFYCVVFINLTVTLLNPSIHVQSDRLAYDNVMPNKMVHSADDPEDQQLTVLVPWFTGATDLVILNSILVSSMVTKLSAVKPPVVICLFMLQTVPSQTIHNVYFELHVSLSLGQCAHCVAINEFFCTKLAFQYAMLVSLG